MSELDNSLSVVLNKYPDIRVISMTRCGLQPSFSDNLHLFILLLRPRLFIPSSHCFLSVQRTEREKERSFWGFEGGGDVSVIPPQALGIPAGVCSAAKALKAN